MRFRDLHHYLDRRVRIRGTDMKGTVIALHNLDNHVFIVLDGRKLKNKQAYHFEELKLLKAKP